MQTKWKEGRRIPTSSAQAETVAELDFLMDDWLLVAALACLQSTQDYIRIWRGADSMQRANMTSRREETN